jgi:hypothetical protein
LDLCTAALSFLSLCKGLFLCILESLFLRFGLLKASMNIIQLPLSIVEIYGMNLFLK